MKIGWISKFGITLNGRWSIINNNEKKVSAIILAAGISKRMGRQKLLLPLYHTTILGLTIENVKKAGFEEIILVLGADKDRILREINTEGLKIVINNDYQKGQSTSVKCGLSAISGNSAAIFILGDQPFINSDIYKRLLLAYKESNALIVLPATEDGKRGNPVIFAPELFEKILTIEGDKGPRGLIEDYQQSALIVKIPDSVIHLDIDTPQTYEIILKKEGDK